MWTRKELKTKAKAVLKGSYWKAFLVSLVLLISGGGDNGGLGLKWLEGNDNHNSSYAQTREDTYNNSYNNYTDTYRGSRLNSIVDKSAIISRIKADADRRATRIILIMMIVGIIVLLAIAAFRIFLGYSLEVGSKKYYVDASRGNPDMNLLSFGFNKPNYKNIIKTLIYKDTMNFLWLLLFIIPGVIKAYSYMMVPYLLGDNPNINHKEALFLSTKMMRGEKFKTFVLELSFLGWYILGFLALFIGVIFVNPYVYQTKAELYLALRNKIDSETDPYGNTAVIENN